MKLVVDLNDEVYNNIVIKNEYTCMDVIAVHNALVGAIHLPKSHGDLITKEQAIELVEFYQINPQHFDFVNLIDDIKNEKPIIEADKDGDKE